MSPARRRKKAASKTALPGSREALIRMYDVGFGDCFLLLLPAADRAHKVLFDCGSVAAGARPMSQVVQQVIQHVTDSDGVPRIDVVVCTHRHRDHVSGFADAAWKNVEVGEVWMPWTEHPTDPEARRIRDVQARLALTLNAQMLRQMAAPTASSRVVSRLQTFQDLALNALSNEDAMRTLHSGFRGNPRRRFLPEKDKDGNLERHLRTPVLPGIVVHVLGPSHDQAVIRDMDPPAGQSYLQLAGDSAGDSQQLPSAFPTEWWIRPDRYPSFLRLPPKDRKAVENTGIGLEPAVAVALDKAVNGTSLMLVLQAGGTHLLFPGDAQWGTWHSALDNQEWKQMLRQTAFYKIGHHGSHNATPVEFVEDTVGKDFWAMVSTRLVKQWPRIPKRELLAALGRRTRKLARSDQASKAPKTAFTVIPGEYVETRLPL